MFGKGSNYSIFFTLPLLVYLGYTFYMHMGSSLYMSLIDTLDFFIHEFGHIFFGIFGNQFLAVAGGTIMQLLIPFLILIGFYMQDDQFAVSFCIAWIATNFFYISTYSGDALRLSLPLIGVGGGDTIHDWNYIFKNLGVLSHTDLISNIFFITAVSLFIFSFIYSTILIVNRIRQS